MLSDVPNGPGEKPWHRVFAWIAFLFSLAVYPILLTYYARATSPTFDEGMHIAAGYRYWQCGDYAINPEHPPLLKLIAAAPVRKRVIEGYDGACGTEVTNNARLIAVGYRLLNEPDANEILLQARKAALLFPLLLLVTIFFAARAWFGWLAAGAAVLLAAFEPNLTAHGALVTTDLAVAGTKV